MATWVLCTDDYLALVVIGFILALAWALLLSVVHLQHCIRLFNHKVSRFPTPSSRRSGSTGRTSRGSRSSRLSSLRSSISSLQRHNALMGAWAANGAPRYFPATIEQWDLESEFNGSNESLSPEVRATVESTPDTI